MPYAAIPTIFALQQLVEGGLWLALPASSSWAGPLTITYLIFSNIFWPIYVPLAVMMIEPSMAHRRRLVFPIIAGVGTGGFFLFALTMHPVTAAITGSHIHYDLPHSHDKIAFAFYAAATCLAPLLSSHTMVRLFGVVIVAAMAAAYATYMNWFASVWCFFAGLLSCTVYLHFRRSDMLRSPAAPIQPPIQPV